MPTRREFLTTTAGALGGIGLSDGLLNVTPLSAAETSLTPDLVQLSPDIEPIVRLIEQTPREKCAEVMVQQLKRGLPYRQFVAALFLAGIRNVNPQPPGFKFHCVFVIHAAHQMSLDAAVGDRLLPLFWALDNFKESQERDVKEGDFQLKPVTGKLPSPTTAWKDFHDAMEEWDEAKADRAITVLVRTSSAHRIIEELWRYGARDYRNIGHKAIFVANTWRTLQTIGWRHAEPALRSLVLGLLDFGKSERVNDYVLSDQSFYPNLETVREEAQALPAGWATAQGELLTIVSVLDAVRSGNSKEACREVMKSLSDGRAGGSRMWDTVHLTAGELMMRQPGIYGIHTVTSASALRYAYETANSDRTRLLMLLQAVGWMCQFKNFMSKKPAGLSDLNITELVPAEKVTTTAEIFDAVGNDSALAAAQAMAFAQANPAPTEFVRTANRLLLHKAQDAHDFKYAQSIFDDYRRVSPHFRPHMLATATYYLRGHNSPDSPVVQRAADLLGTL